MQPAGCVAWNEMNFLIQVCGQNPSFEFIVSILFQSRLNITGLKMRTDKRIKCHWWAFLLLAISAFICRFAHGQTGSENQSVADTSSPRATLKSFIDACNDLYLLIERDKILNRSLSSDYYNNSLRALDCLDTSQLPAFARVEGSAEVAVCLKEIIDRAELPPWDEIPDILEIEKSGGFENLTRWRIPGTRITIARIEKGS